ncbi:5-methylcytosine-specific restriction protein B [Chryseobacterium sp. SLBN-27]|uniref:AAA family ATPase n=1 Tax=Chryseobacterium sp. SLBN-27 TaxID=3042287 RepID=UPI00285E47E4|nr:AAA family ATPase [Chryseobacterium sp. SLBN-27]MDR6157139.1 5-methylcytosine-specific restriction protein B [Chryseobacterium sp. SLBN-27]
MDINLQNKISEYLKAERNQAIINSDEFYFQKAQDELQKFLNLEVREEEKQILIANKKKYEELKKLFQDSEEFYEFGKTIFSLVSYCDLKAYKKNELNQYDDKRVLASAFVRMNNWLEQLITYKFEGQLSEGSVKNAMEYLLHPEDHFTMLSENHRSLISENLFKKSYNKSTFKQDFIDFFSGLSIQVKNPVNYTHLLSCLSYDISPEWKESIIGLMSPDGTGWQEGAINDLNGADYIILWNHRKPNGTTKTFKLLKDCIDENGSFKIFYTSKNNAIYIAEVIDFATSAQEYNKADWENNYENITWKLDSFDEYKDGDKSASWVYLVNKFYQIEPIPSSHFKYYFPSGYPSVGSQTPIISMISNIEFKKNQNMKKNIELLQYKKQIILQGPPGTGKTREAKLIAQNILGLNEKELQESEQFKIIQFHPSYTYEDFVRGIVAESKGDKIEYKNVNKILGEFAKVAKENFDNHHKELKDYSKEVQAKEYFEKFIEYVQDLIEEKNGYYELTENVGLINTDDEEAFRYKGKNDGWLKNGNRMLFKDILRSFLDNNKERQDVKKNNNISGLARQHASYFVRVLNLFQNFLNNNNYTFSEVNIDKEPLKKYILVIDEINRANLSSVLGELIYALEYRGEEVESMYEVDGSQKLVLPPNLYIIGTMNTADRSVGHIDYAIRRRFAFVDVMPKDLTAEMGNGEFYTALFYAVKALFTKDEYETKSDFISHEFEPKDVALGHSYFIDKSKDKGDMKVRWNYEIKPILLEYVRDGVLKTDALKKINEMETTFSLKIE